MVLADGNAIGGDSMVVMPPSTSFASAAVPAASPVMRQFAVPPPHAGGCNAVPDWLVDSGSPRCQRPEVAVFESAARIQAFCVSKLSVNSCVGADAGWNSAVNVVSSVGVEISCVCASPSDHDAKS